MVNSMAIGQYLSLEEARNKRKLERFIKEHEWISFKTDIQTSFICSTHDERF